MKDCLIIGAGAVGLSLAYELAGHGICVTVIDRSACGTEASWAGAGIIPAAKSRAGDSAYTQLSGLSCQLHAQWAKDLQSDTGIDTGYRQCGEIFFGHQQISGDPLSRDLQTLESLGVEIDHLDQQVLKKLEPAISDECLAGADLPAYRTPASAQIRNPWLLRAIREACLQRGVKIVEQVEVLGFDLEQDRIVAAETTSGSFSAEQVCLTSGAWTKALAGKVGISLPMKPIRGQIVLLRLNEQIQQNIIHHGPHYLVPRPDGYVLAGTTLEDVGFEKQTTVKAVREILHFASSMFPQLATAQVERCWAGLRPASLDGHPFIGLLPGFSNGWVATGHFRWGLYLSPATAVVLSQLMRGLTPQIDLTEFRVDRHVLPLLQNTS